MVMKLFNILYAAGLLLLAAACEKDLPTFSDDEGFLIFNYGAGKKTGDATVSESDRRGSYSFLLNAAEEQTRDTVWLKALSGLPANSLGADGGYEPERYQCRGRKTLCGFRRFLARRTLSHARRFLCDGSAGGGASGSFFEGKRCDVKDYFRRQRLV